MIPRNKQGRYSGTGGGGKCASGGVTPYWCKRCGKTKPASAMLENCDVCKKCRVKK